jgi:hypothetical protein
LDGCPKGGVWAVAFFAVFCCQMGLWAQKEEAPLSVRDPFVSVLDLEKQDAQMRISRHLDVSQFALKGIVWNEKLSVAIINDELFIAGDVCKDLKIKAIDSHAVVLTDGTAVFRLSMADEILPSGETSGAEAVSEEVSAQEGPVREAPMPSERERGFFRRGSRSSSQRAPLSMNSYE